MRTVIPKRGYITHVRLRCPSCSTTDRARTFAVQPELTGQTRCPWCRAPLEAKANRFGTKR